MLETIIQRIFDTFNKKITKVKEKHNPHGKEKNNPIKNK